MTQQDSSPLDPDRFGPDELLQPGTGAGQGRMHVLAVFPGDGSGFSHPAKPCFDPPACPCIRVALPVDDQKPRPEQPHQGSGSLPEQDRSRIPQQARLLTAVNPRQSSSSPGTSRSPATVGIRAPPSHGAHPSWSSTPAGASPAIAASSAALTAWAISVSEEPAPLPTSSSGASSNRTAVKERRSRSGNVLMEWQAPRTAPGSSCICRARTA